MYPQLIKLVEEIRKIPQVKTISMQTNGTLLTEEKIKKLESAGVDRINLSMDAFDNETSRKISGIAWFDSDRIKKMARNIVESKMDLLIAPVYLPKINDDQIPKIIRFALEIGAGKKWPPLGIQKYEKYRLGRIPKGLKIQSRWQFYNRSIKEWEKQFKIKLRLSRKDFNIEKCEPYPTVIDRNEKLKVKLVAPGWLKGESIGTARNRSVLVLNSDEVGREIKVKILSNKHGVYVAEAV